MSWRQTLEILADGLVARVPHPTDRRATLAEITPAGRSVVTDAAKALAAEDYGLEGMAGTHLSTVERSLRSLRSAAGDFGVGPPSKGHTPVGSIS